MAIHTTSRHVEPRAYTVKAVDPPRACVIWDQDVAAGDKVVLRALTTEDSVCRIWGCAHGAIAPQRVQ